MFASFASTFYLSFLILWTTPVPVFATVSTSTKSAAVISLQLGRYIDKVIKTLASDDIRQLLVDTRIAISLHALNPIVPTILFSMPTLAGVTTLISRLTLKINAFTLSCLLLLWRCLQDLLISLTRNRVLISSSVRIQRCFTFHKRS